MSDNLKKDDLAPELQSGENQNASNNNGPSPMLEPMPNNVNYNNNNNNGNNPYMQNNPNYNNSGNNLGLFQSIQKLSFIIIILMLVDVLAIILVAVLAFVPFLGIFLIIALVGVAIATLVLEIMLTIKVSEAKGKHPEFQDVTVHLVLMILGIVLLPLLSFIDCFILNSKAKTVLANAR